MPNPENSTIVITHSGESSCHTVTNPGNVNTELGNGSGNNLLGKRYHPIRHPGFKSFTELEITHNNVLGFFTDSTFEQDSSAPDFSGTNNDLSLITHFSHWAPNLIPPDVSTLRGAFEANGDSEISSYSEEHPFFGNAKNFLGDARFLEKNPKNSSEALKSRAASILSRRRD